MRHLAYCTLPNGVKLARYESDSRASVRRSVRDETGRGARHVRGGGTGGGGCESRRRQSRRHLHSQRAVRVAAAAAIYAGLGRRRHGCGGGQRCARHQGGRPRVHHRHDRRPRVRLVRRACGVHDRSGSSSPEPHHRLPKAPASASLMSPHGVRSSTEGGRSRARRS